MRAQQERDGDDHRELDDAEECEHQGRFPGACQICDTVNYARQPAARKAVQNWRK